VAALSDMAGKRDPVHCSRHLDIRYEEVEDRVCFEICQCLICGGCLDDLIARIHDDIRRVQQDERLIVNDESDRRAGTATLSWVIPYNSPPHISFRPASIISYGIVRFFNKLLRRHNGQVEREIARAILTTVGWTSVVM
jgi:hypothetical protein